ncbi:MAG: lysophospholipid acyltransferase family protein [Chloroflexota bacterium]|jgi:1-acyl-sn-glycerol-3-phosphate acyltransferase
MFYKIACFVVRLLLRILTRCRVEGIENVPPTGPFLLAANHLNLVDPPVLGALLPRQITFMAKDELFKTPIIGWVVTWYGAFPVRRGQPDRQALRTAAFVLEKGGVVGMFPEGTRSKTGRLKEALPGAAMLAALASAPVLPVALIGTEKLRSVFSFITRPEITVRIGKPFNIERDRSRRESLDEATRAMMARVAALLPEERRGYYSDAAQKMLESEPSLVKYQG